MALVTSAQAGPYFLRSGARASTFARSAFSRSASLFQSDGVVSAWKRPLSALKLFSMPNSSASPMRACSGDDCVNMVSAPRYCARSKSRSGSAMSRWYCSSRTVSSRSVPPGCPETKVRSPSFAPAGDHLK